jgi:hypothetical protein
MAGLRVVSIYITTTKANSTASRTTRQTKQHPHTQKHLRNTPNRARKEILQRPLQPRLILNLMLDLGSGHVLSLSSLRLFEADHANSFQSESDSSLATFRALLLLSGGNWEGICNNSLRACRPQSLPPLTLCFPCARAR